MSSENKSPATEPNSLVINGIPVAWNKNNEGFSFLGIDSILFWCRPSLVSFLQPMQEELGEELYSRLTAFESSKGTYEDYHSIVTLGKTFEEGFQMWGMGSAACGWGTIALVSIDWDKKSAKITITNPWELKIGRARSLENEMPFLNGKVSGVFSHVFGTNCRAQVLAIHNNSSGVPVATLRIEPSKKTLEEALADLGEKNTDEVVRLRSVNNALRRNEKRLLDVIDTVGDFIWETDRNLRFTYATNQAFKTLKISEANLLGKTWQELMKPEESDRLKLLLSNISENSPFAEGEFPIVHLNDENSWVYLRVKKILDFSGNHLGYVGSGRNVTREKILNNQIIAQQKKAEFSAKMASLGEMAGGMAHEINTPLASISLLSEQLIEELGVDSKNSATANVILETAERIGKIIQGLKTFARDASEDQYEISSVERIITDSVALCQSRFKNGAITLKISPVSKEVKVRCRATQITQVILNLLNNSFDAVHSLSERWVEIRVEQLENKLLIRITDSGGGIKPEFRQKLMQPFFTTKPVGTGTGLGLSVSKGIIESHGGTLVYDEHSAHTSFTIELPL